MVTRACGTGLWSGPKPGDPDNSSILSAAPAYGGVDVVWSYPVINPHALSYVRLYRGILPDFDTAILLREVAGGYYFDRVEFDVPIEYYYWIQMVSINGTVGDLIGPAYCLVKPAIEWTIEQLSQKIDEGLLSQALRFKLDQISSINTSLLGEIKAREDSSVSLQQAIDQAVQGSAAALTFVHREILDRVEKDRVALQQMEVIAATLKEDYAAVTQQIVIDLNELEKTANAMWTVNVDVNGLAGGFGMINDGKTVEAGFNCDRFWVGRSGVTKKYPFIVNDGQVYINEAIVNSIQSEDFLAGSKGWKLDRGADIELNNATFRGQLDIKSMLPGSKAGTKMTNDKIEVFDDQGRVRVRIGKLS